jgi:hypothetical protein
LAATGVVATPVLGGLAGAFAFVVVFATAFAACLTAILVGDVALFANVVLGSFLAATPAGLLFGFDDRGF